MAYEFVRETNLFEDDADLITYESTLDEDGVVHKKEKVRNVFVRVGSIYEQEYREALKAGVTLRWKLVMNYADWEEGKEMVVRYKGELLSVHRKFRKGDEIEVYVKEYVGSWDNGKIA